MVHSSSRYEVRNEADAEVGEDILELMFGSLWKFVMDRVNHQFDGHVFTFHHQGQEFRVYRKLTTSV